MCLEMLEGFEDRSSPLQGGVVGGAWNIANPPGRGVLPLDPTQEAPEQEGD